MCHLLLPFRSVAVVLIAKVAEFHTVRVDLLLFEFNCVVVFNQIQICLVFVHLCDVIVILSDKSIVEVVGLLRGSCIGEEVVTGLVCKLSRASLTVCLLDELVSLKVLSHMRIVVACRSVALREFINVV